MIRPTLRRNRVSLIRNILATSAVALLVANSLAAQATAAEFFLDNFGDGDHADGTPVLWSPGGSPSGERKVIDGRLVHTPNGTQNMSTYVDECFGDASCRFDDASLLTSFEVTGGTPTYVTLFARSLASPDGTLYGGTDASGNAVLGMSIGGAVTILRQSPTGLDPATDEISLRFDVQGNEMALWMWSADGQQTDAATATATIPVSYPNDEGTVGFFYNPSASSSVSFDFFEVKPVPEPSGLTLTMLAALIGLFFRRQPNQ